MSDAEAKQRSGTFGNTVRIVGLITIPLDGLIRGKIERQIKELEGQKIELSKKFIPIDLEKERGWL